MSKHHNLIDSYDVIDQIDLSKETKKPKEKNESINLDFIDEAFIENFLLKKKKNIIEKNDETEKNDENDFIKTLFKYLFLSGSLYYFTL